MSNKKMHYTVEDTEGNTGVISSEFFHKITNPANFSRKFIAYKIANHIVDL